MADWYGTSRSNYFAVKDRAAFEAWAKGLGLKVYAEPSDRGELVGIFEQNGYGWPTPPEDDGESDIYAALAAHLADGEVAILVSAGAEKQRYVSGHAVALTTKGVVEELWLSDIVALARKHTARPDDVTAPEY